MKLTYPPTLVTLRSRSTSRSTSREASPSVSTSASTTYGRYARKSLIGSGTRQAAATAGSGASRST